MNPALSPALLEQVRAAYEQISGLPFPVHATLSDGTMFLANKAAREFFGMSQELDLDGIKIQSFYEDSREREQVLRKLRHSSPGEWHNNITIRLKVGSEHRKSRLSTLPFFDPKDGHLAAMLNITSSMTEVEWFAEFEDTFDAGFFEMDERFAITSCNAKTAEILNYSDKNALSGKPVSELFWEPGQVNTLREELLRTQHLHNKRLKLRSKGGAMVIVNMHCLAVPDETGLITRAKGVIRDVTFDIIAKDVPVGLFMVTTNAEGEEIFSRANEAFAHIYGFQSEEEIIGRPINEFHVSPAVYADFKKALDEAADNDLPLLDYFLDMKDVHGKKHNIVTNVRYMPGENRRLRVGVAYDLTDHVGKQLRILEADFGALLHTYIATVNGLRDTMGMLIKAHGYDVMANDKQIDRSITANVLSGHIKRLGSLVTELEKMGTERGVNEELFERVRKPWRRLTEKQMEREKDNASWARRNMIEMRNALDALKKTGLPRELLKSARTEVDEILRLTTVTSLSLSLDELNERIPEFYYFRDYLRRKETELQDAKPQNIISILLDATQFLEEFASIRKVAILHHLNPNEQVLVNCNKASLNRAFSCLLHNAIKYSWSKRGDNPAYIDIRVDKKPDSIEIVIENWGVAIRRQELENDLIFQFGQRGQIADDRGRSGTGIGLYDAHNIITKHGGTLRLTSEPTFGNPAEVYSHPFITKAFITLPIVKQP
ncbi:MAG: PAS domain-containing protein [Lewinellaceae bacterium]|nr:PAS domain-containing protein [Lewinellaceae bacterium]